MARINQRQMETLSTTLGGKRTKPKGTVGKVVPVAKRSNPYLKPMPKGGTSPSSPSITNALGAQAQQRNIENKVVSPTVDVNYESDPVLARIRALNQQDVGNVRTAANAERKQAVIDTGLADVGAEIGLDSATLQAARENPFSLAQRLSRESQERGVQMDESLNQQNLFYGGARVNKLGELARNTAEEQNDLGRQLRMALGGIDSTVMGAEQDAAFREQGAFEDAAAEARQAALQQAYIDALSAPATDPSIGIDPVTGLPIETPSASLLAPQTVPQILTPEEELLMALGATPNTTGKYLMG